MRVFWAWLSVRRYGWARSKEGIILGMNYVIFLSGNSECSQRGCASRAAVTAGGAQGEVRVPTGTAHVPNVSQDPNQMENNRNGGALPFRPPLPAAHRPHLCRATGGDVGRIKAPLHPPGSTRGGRGSVTCGASQELEQMVWGGAQVKDRAQWGWGRAALGARCKRGGRAGVQHPELCCPTEGCGGGGRGSTHPNASSQPLCYRHRRQEPSHRPCQPGPCPVPSEGAVRAAGRPSAAAGRRTAALLGRSCSEGCGQVGGWLGCSPPHRGGPFSGAEPELNETA